MVLRTTRRIGILLFACAAIPACAGLSGQGDSAQVEQTGDVLPAHGTAVFKRVEPNLRKAIATHEGRDVVVYWDDQTIFVRGGKPTRVSSKYWVADTPAAKTPAAGTMPTSTPPSGQYFKEAKVMADLELPKPGEVFEFRGFKTHGEIALRVVDFK